MCTSQKGAIVLNFKALGLNSPDPEGLLKSSLRMTEWQLSLEGVILVLHPGQRPSWVILESLRFF